MPKPTARLRLTFMVRLVQGHRRRFFFTLPLGTPTTNYQINPTALQLANLRAGELYMDVHSAGFPDGEVRGQLRWNPLEEAQFFVNQAYFDFLSRNPDRSGFAFWTDIIAPCASDVRCLREKRIDVSNAFFFEQEYQQTGAYVYCLYRIAYGNNQPFANPNSDPVFPNEEKKQPSYAAFVADRARVVGGTDLAQSQQDLANAFLQRPHFNSKYSPGFNLTEFVDALLNSIGTDLGVDLASQRSALIALGTRGAVLYRLADDSPTNPINNRPAD